MNEIETMARRHFNEPVLTGFEVGRLVGYAEDEQDCYLVIEYPRTTLRPGRVWHTAVGGYVFLGALKGQGHVVSNTGEEWDDFIRTDNLLALNGAPRAEEFFVEYRTPAATLPLDGRRPPAATADHG